MVAGTEATGLETRAAGAISSGTLRPHKINSDLMASKAWAAQEAWVEAAMAAKASVAMAARAEATPLLLLMIGGAVAILPLHGGAVAGAGPEGAESEV